MSARFENPAHFFKQVFTPLAVIELARDQIITVESLIYSVPRNQLLWAAVSETRNPRALPQFIEELVKESVAELRKQGLARSLPKR